MVAGYGEVTGEVTGDVTGELSCALPWGSVASWHGYVATTDGTDGRGLTSTWVPGAYS